MPIPPAPLPGSPWSPQAACPDKTPLHCWFLSPSFLQALPNPPCHLPHSSSKSKISACVFPGWQSDNQEGTDLSLPVLSLRHAQGVLGTQPRSWGSSPRASIPLSHHPRQPPSAPARSPPPSHLPQPLKKTEPAPKSPQFPPLTEDSASPSPPPTPSSAHSLPLL